MSSPAVCVACLTDRSLQRRAKERATIRRCDFCGRRAKVPIAVTENAVIEDVLRCVGRSWREHRLGEVPTGAATWPWVILNFTQVLSQERQSAFACDPFLDHVAMVLSDRLWSPRDGALTQREVLQFSWALFEETVKHGARFFFAQNDGTDAPRAKDDPVRRGNEILSELGHLVRTFDLVREISEGLILVRVRLHEPDEEPVSAAELGTPPRRAARQARMSAAGIPAFYAAEDAETAMMEAIDATCRGATLAEFETTRTMRIVDLTAVPAMPSLFDLSPASRSRRAVIAFLADLADEVSLPFKRDDRIHIEYVPTQVVSEFFRHSFRDGDGWSVNGIAWRSARRPEGRCVVLFVDSIDCLDPGQPAPGGRLALRLRSRVRLDVS